MPTGLTTSRHALVSDRFRMVQLVATPPKEIVPALRTRRRGIGRQIFNIEPHVRFYSNALIRRSKFAIFYAGFCVVSARKSGPPDALRCAPVDAFNQHRELRHR